MQHLKLEEIARLVEEEPTVEESLHLELCASCAEQLAEMRKLRAELGGLADPPLPADSWAALERSLQAEGLIGEGTRRGWLRSPAFRAAAALLLFVSGAVAGGLAMTTGVYASVFEGAPDQEEAPLPTTDVAVATEALQRAEANYLNAVMTYAELTQPVEELDPINRLEALEGIVVTTGEALREDPADPVINNYHLTALAQRDALLRQLEEIQGEEWF